MNTPTQSTLDLIKQLKAIENNTNISAVEYLHSVLKDGSIFHPKDEWDGVSCDMQHDDIISAEGTAVDALITSEGQCVWEQHDILKQHGYEVFPGEVDGFGWLTGCIRTKKGILVYG